MKRIAFVLSSLGFAAVANAQAPAAPATESNAPAAVAAPVTAKLDSAVATQKQGVSVSFGAGASFPLSDLGDAFDTGFNVFGGLGFNVPALPIALRAEVAYNKFSAKGTGEDLNLTTGSLNGIIQLPLHSTGVSPYLIVGAGVGHADAGGTTSNKLFWTGGAGVKATLSGFDAFVEGLYSAVETETRSSYVPVRAGLTFRL